MRAARDVRDARTSPWSWRACAAAVLLMAGLARRAGGTAAAGPAPREFDDCDAAAWCPRMVALPAGAFVMGSPKGERGRFDDEAQRRVRLAGFAIGKHPVTRGQWAAFVAATGRPAPASPCAYARVERASWRNPGFPQGDDHPVVCVSWGDAQDYARWLSARTGRRYRLLTDAEWEYAARAGTTTAFPWGAVASHEYGNYGADSCCGPAVRGRDRWAFTSPVGAFPPNAFGLHEMHGNVTAWVETCADATERLPMPTGAHGCVYRYGRGGNFDEYPALVRSAAKNIAPPPGGPQTIATYRSVGFGVRVARDLDGAPPPAS
jgi:formylglycine-generating enzyme required for sulfatase activity